MSYAIAQYENKLDRRLAGKFNAGKHGDLQWAAEKQYALAQIYKNDALQRCTPESFAMSMLDCAWTGLSLNPVTSQAYLIPYKNTMTFKPSYRGLEHLVYRAGTIRSIQTVLVRKGDTFKVETKNNRRVITHIEKGDTRQEVTHAYCILHYANGGEYVEVMDIHQLNAVQAQAEKSPGGGMVWRSAWKGEMQRKAVLRRALKHAPLDGAGQMAHAIEVADKYDPIEFDRAPVEREATEVLISEDQHLSAHAWLTDRELPAETASVWLTKLAEAMGFAAFDEMPAKHYDEAMARLKTRFEAWRAKHEQS